MKKLIMILMLVPFFLSGCASTPEMIANDAKMEVPKFEKTKVPLSKFASATLKPLMINDKIKADEGKLAKAKELDSMMEQQLNDLITNWPSENPDHGELIIQPKVVHLRIISNTTRMLAGLFAGQSSVSVQLNLLDSQTGEPVAAPEITKVTLGSAGPGITDKNILEYITHISHQYLLENMK